ncbi:hypothetical protein Agub_g4426, partial [Astrephomene gubernaculifera]
MWRIRGHCPFRGLRCYSARRSIVRKAVKSQLQDGRVGAEQVSAHANHSWSDVGLHSLQHLPSLTPGVQHRGPPCTSPNPGSNDTEPVASVQQVEQQQQPASPYSSSSSSSSECRRGDCEPSTSDAPADGWWKPEQELSPREQAALNRRIMLCRSVGEMSELVRCYRRSMNYIHTSAAIVTLARLISAPASSKRQRTQQQQHKHGRPHPGFKPQPPQQQQAATTTTAAAAASTAVQRPGPLEAEAAAAEGRKGAPQQQQQQRQPQCRQPQQPPIAGTPSASPASPCPHRLLADLTSHFLAQRFSTKSARQYANVVWALGCLRAALDPQQAPQQSPHQRPHQAAHQSPHPQQPQPYPHPQLLDSTAADLLGSGYYKLTSAAPQELSNLALGLAKLGYRQGPLWAALTAAARRRLPAFKPQELHNLAWAVAAAGQDRGMVAAVAAAALPRLREMNGSGLANLLWSCATAECGPGEVFQAAAEVMLGR